MVLSLLFLDKSMFQKSMILKVLKGFSFQLKSSRFTDVMRFERSLVLSCYLKNTLLVSLVKDSHFTGHELLLHTVRTEIISSIRRNVSGN